MFYKKHHWGILATALLVSISTCSIAQNKVGLKQAIDSAIKNYPELHVKQLETQSADAAVREAKDDRLPSLILSDQVDMGTANSLSSSYFPMGVIPSTSGGISNENNPKVSAGNIGVAYMQHELYNFGLNRARIASAQSLANSSKADYNATSYTLQYQVSQLFFNMLKYKLLTNIQQQNVARYTTLFNYIKAYTGSGIKAGVDSSIANAEISKAKIQYIQTLETYDKLRLEFAYYTGIRNTNFEIDTASYHLSPAQIGQLQLNVSADSVSSTNPVLAYYNSQWQYAVSQEELTKRSFLPKLYLLGSVWARGSSISPVDGYQDYSAGLNYSRYNYMAGLAFTYNLFDVVHRRDKVASQYFHAEAALEEVNQQKQILNNQLQQADIAIQAVLNREKEIPIQLQAAQNAYSQKLAQYNAGIANIAELTDASYLLYTAETDSVEIESDLMKTLLQKAVVNNTLNVFISNF